MILQRKDYENYIACKRETRLMQERELRVLQDRELQVKQQTEAEVRFMQAAMEEEKEALREDMRCRIEAGMKQQGSQPSFEPEQEHVAQQKIAELEKEAKELKSLMNGLEQMIAVVVEDNNKLQHNNDEVNGMFKQVNEFTKKKFEEKKVFSAKQKKLTKVLIPKVKSDIATASLEFMVESKWQEVYRGGMYKTVKGVWASDRYDQLLYDEVMDLIQECETALGKEVLDFNQSLEDFAEGNAEEFYGDNPDDGGQNFNQYLEASQDNWNNWNESQYVGANQSQYVDQNWNESQYVEEGQNWNEGQYVEEGQNLNESQDLDSEQKNLNESQYVEDSGQNWNESQKVDSGQNWNESQNVVTCKVADIKENEHEEDPNSDVMREWTDP
jgi:hypothetical protein